ncbi:hypothetical protein ACOI7N_27385 [Pseudomonas sp. P2758]|uniref:hypothetical protein n=1 Tax=Pseudomonas sp. P2758 TaxID=3409916 RepID=UPI003B5BC033
MQSRIANTFFIFALLAGTASAAQPSANDQFPHIPVMAHQTMTYNGKVIYEADVDQNDPKRKPFVLRVKVDDLSSDCASTIGNVAGSASQDRSLGNKSSSAYMMSCVVTEISSNGQAKADVTYNIQDDARSVHKSGHVKASMQVGKVYETTNNGSKVSLLLQTY